VLWSKIPNLVKGEETLKAASLAKLSICNPLAVPYGAAAVEGMKSLKVYGPLQPKFVEGTNITQAFQFVQTGNAELGFVALSQFTRNESGSRWLVPQTLYTPILQDAVLLKKGASNEAATAFITFLKGPEARATRRSTRRSLGARTLAFTFQGLIIGSVMYSMRFVVQPIRNSFAAIGDRPLEVAATLRASPRGRPPDHTKCRRLASGTIWLRG
jgi:hypothetical protein